LYPIDRADGGLDAEAVLRLTRVPDFFIAAHAEVAELTLLTRDPRRVRTYFPSVAPICPEAGDAITVGHRLADTSALDAVVQELRRRPGGSALRVAA